MMKFFLALALLSASAAAQGPVREDLVSGYDFTPPVIELRDMNGTEPTEASEEVYLITGLIHEPGKSQRPDDVQTVEVEVVDSAGRRWKAKWVLTK